MPVAKKPEKKVATGRYVIVHGAVGPFPEGRVVSRKDIEDRGDTPERLMGLMVGDTPAIRETEDDLTTDPLPLGPLNRTTPPVIVPDQATPKPPVRATTEVPETPASETATRPLAPPPKK